MSGNLEAPTVPPASATTVVYALHGGSSGILSYSATPDRAKEDAETRLRGYWESAREHPEDWSDANLLKSLTWEMKPHVWHKHFPAAAPRWTAMMDDLYAFTIEEIAVLT